LVQIEIATGVYLNIKCKMLQKKILPAFEHQLSDEHKVLPMTFVTVYVFGHVDKRKKTLKYTRTSSKKIWFTIEIQVYEL
jgi:hypothetical protein